MPSMPLKDASPTEGLLDRENQSQARPPEHATPSPIANPDIELAKGAMACSTGDDFKEMLDLYFRQTSAPPPDHVARYDCDALLRETFYSGGGVPSPKPGLAPIKPRTGVARSCSHVGELAQGAIRLPGLPASKRDPRLPTMGPIAARCLIDLPTPIFHSTASVTVRLGGGAIQVKRGKAKVLKAARLFLRLLGMHGEVDVEIKIRTNIPEGRGLGSSSADVRATLNALASALGLSVSPELVDFLTVRAEDATNPGTGQPSLFYHRLGLTGIRLPKFPALAVVPFDDPAATDVITNDFKPASYSIAQVYDYERLFRAAVSAIRDGDARGLAATATRSAEINEEFLIRQGKTTIRMLHCIRRCSNALGFAVSHSGTVGAFLFDQKDANVDAHVAKAQATLMDVGCALFKTYTIG